MKKVIHKHTYIKFTGKYSDLKGLGFKFQKLYARNYMQWHKNLGENGYGYGIRVWKKGGEVELDDLHELSYLVLEAIRSNNMVLTNGILGGSWYAFAINKNNCTIEPWEFRKHTNWAFLQDKGVVNDKLESIVTEETYKEALNEYYDTWREYHISPEFVAMIKEFDGMMEVVKIKE